MNDNQNIEVIISSGGVYHVYHTVRAAQKAGYLKRFITGIYLPSEQGIPDDLIKKIPIPNYVGHAIQQFPSPNSQYFSYLIRDNMFDWLARRHIEDCDVFHGWNHMSLYQMRRAKQLGAKTIIERSSTHPVVQEQILLEEFERFGVPYPKGMQWLIDKHLQEYEEADAIAVCSEFVARTLRENGIPQDKLRYVHLGFDPQRFEPGTKQDDTFRVMFAGMISLRKGIPYLLEAFKRLNLPDSELILVGGYAPDSRVFISQYEGLYKHVPFVQQSELAAYYQSSDVLVMPSLEEGFGMTVYEAAACGVPSIVSENVGAVLRDEKDCFIFPLRDVEALMEYLMRLYENRDLSRQMGESARQFVQRFTWDNYHTEMQQHYKELASH